MGETYQLTDSQRHLLAISSRYQKPEQKKVVRFSGLMRRLYQDIVMLLNRKAEEQSEALSDFLGQLDEFEKAGLWFVLNQDKKIILLQVFLFHACTYFSKH